MSERAVFNLLWDMWHELDDDDYKGFDENRNYGTIISRYAHIIDDRIENSGNSRSVTSLKLYDTKQLKDEIASRTHTKSKSKETM